MPLTPETLPRHELNGLFVRVVDADDPGMIGIAGRVVEETTRTLSVSDGSRVRQVPKRGAVFEFRLPIADDADAGQSAHADTDEAAGGREAPGTAFEPGSVDGEGDDGNDDAVDGADVDDSGGPGEDAVYVTVDGERLLSRPARRTETTGDSLWR